MQTKIPTRRDLIPKWAAFVGIAFVVACCAALMVGAK